jgi:hypothetical protein
MSRATALRLRYIISAEGATAPFRPLVNEPGPNAIVPIFDGTSLRETRHRRKLTTFRTKSAK